MNYLLFMIGSVIFIALLAYTIAMLFVKVFYYVALVFQFACTLIGFLVFGLIIYSIYFHEHLSSIQEQETVMEQSIKPVCYSSFQIHT